MRISTASENRYDNSRNSTNNQKPRYPGHGNSSGRITGRSENVRMSIPHKSFEERRSPYGSSGSPENVKESMSMPFYNRLDIVLVRYAADYNQCLTGGTRPALVISATKLNEKCPYMVTFPMTKHMKYIDYEYNVFIDKMDCEGLKDSGMCMCNQFRSVDRKDVIDKLGYVVDARLKEKIDLAVIAALNLAQGG